MIHSYRLAVAILAVTLMPGCEILLVQASVMDAPQYQPDLELVNELKDINFPSMKSGGFSVANDSLNRVYFRLKPMASPYGKTYADYLKKALEEELKQLGLWDQFSKIVISGTLLKNEFDASGTNVGETDISAIFVVTKDGSEIYNKTHTIHHEWESAFLVDTAWPKAEQNFVITIQKLLRNFFLDKDLLIALKE